MNQAACEQMHGIEQVIASRRLYGCGAKQKLISSFSVRHSHNIGWSENRIGTDARRAPSHFAGAAVPDHEADKLFGRLRILKGST